MSWLAIKGSPRRLKKGRRGRRRRLKGAPGRGTLEKEKPPILGMLQRGGEVVIRMLDNVQQTTIAPLIRATLAVGTQVYTDEYDIYARLRDWGYEHSTVCHGRGEYALTSVGFFHYPLLGQLAGHRPLPGVPARALGNPVPVVGDADSAERPG